MAKKKKPASAKASPKASTPNAPAAKGEEQRQHPRVPLDVLVQVRSDSIAQFRALHAKNLSVGGMFIAHPASPAGATESGPVGAAKRLGAQVYFQFTVKDGGTLIEGLGKVVHSSPAGLGVEFVSVLEPSLSIIRALVDERLKAPVPQPA